MRVLILAHGHPELATGGAERAAYALFQALRGSEETEATFLAYAGAAFIGHDAVFGAFRGRPDEILAAPPGYDRFSLLSLDYEALHGLLGEVVARLRPDVVHVHHYIHWGLDMVDIFDRLGVPVVLTLHEYVPICHNEGQMVKTAGPLCEAASPAECAACFPARSPGAFLLREKLVKSGLGRAAHLVAPSRFLAGRFEAWGIDPGRLSVIDNVLGQGRDDASSPAVRPGAPAGVTRFGFFGQITPFKGLDLLLRAVRLLTPAERAALRIGIHGANLEQQTEAFQDEVGRLLRRLRDCVVLVGPYRNTRVRQLMTGYDWIVVPSLWWENAPVVIEEAASAGRPIIGSDIGGVIEKGRRLPGSLFFAAGDAADLAAALRQAMAQPPGPPAHDPGLLAAERDRQAVARLRALYDRVRGERIARL